MIDRRSERNGNECLLLLIWKWVIDKSMVAGISNTLDHNEPFEFESDNETSEVEIDLLLSMQAKLDPST
jgi:hypothetical protein